MQAFKTEQRRKLMKFFDTNDLRSFAREYCYSESFVTSGARPKIEAALLEHWSDNMARDMTAKVLRYVET